MKGKQLPGKILYAILFLIIIPLFQWWWARSLENIVRFPAIESRTGGMIIGVSGILLMVWAMFSLKKFGKGLPMNAYPPLYFVKQGPYHFLRHPIYWGYGLMMTGVFIFTGSASGLWIVTPTSILAIIALVLGYEKIDLEERFKGEDMSVQMDIPSSTDTLPVPVRRLVSFFWVTLFLITSNYFTFFLTRDSIPIWSDSPSMEKFNSFNAIQFLAVPFILLVPFIVKTNKLLHRWVISVLSGIALSVYIALLWPAIGAHYFNRGNEMLYLNELRFLFSTPVFLTFLSATTYSRQFKKWTLLILAFAITIVFLQLTSTKSITINLIVSALIYLVAANYLVIWLFIRRGAEIIANSWKEWVLGPIRIINHGIYVGIGSFAGILFCGLLVGRKYAWAILISAIVFIVFSALWAQIIEGSDKLKRPFGYYGALVGILFASFIFWCMGINGWVVIGIVAVVMPWVQAAGRLRCLVNGCCHGRPTENTTLGIRYFHHRSRVCGISGLKGKYVHPTQVYAILWLFIVGFLLLALWVNKFSYSFIFGMYLILTSTGRFAEEAYRGEVQTPAWKGLRIYQWAAIVSVITGIFFSTINIPPEELHPEYGWEIWMAAFLGGLFTFFTMAVDFPRSNARFSRLV